MTPLWIERTNDRGVFEMAAELGLDPQPPRNSHGGSARCPSCSEERRHKSHRDKRGAIGFRRDDMGWQCFAVCKESGDAVDLASFAMFGKRYRHLSSSQRSEVRERFGGVGGASFSPLPRAPRPTVSAPEYPPEDVRAFYNDTCIPLDQDAQATAYARHRGIHVANAVDRNLARVLPVGAAVPPWAESWGRRGYRLLVPLYDARGALRSVLARSIERAPQGPKSLAPSGYSRAGLVMACPLGRVLLATGARPEWLSSGGRARVCEGEIDWLIASAHVGDAAVDVATVGIVSGAWTAAIAARVPDGFVLDIDTDPDSAGDAYAEQVVRSVAGRALELHREVSP